MLAIKLLLLLGSISVANKYEGPNTEAEDRMRQIYERLTTTHNYSDDDAKAIIANIKHETGHTADPKQKQGGGGPGYGLVQWEGSRKKDLHEWAKKNNRSADDLDTQVDFIAHELSTTEKRAKRKLDEAQTLQDKIKAFSDHYERPGKPHMEMRLKAGQDLEKSPYLNFTGAPTASQEPREMPEKKHQKPAAQQAREAMKGRSLFGELGAAWDRVFGDKEKEEKPTPAIPARRKEDEEEVTMRDRVMEAKPEGLAPDKPKPTTKQEQDQVKGTAVVITDKETGEVDKAKVDNKLNDIEKAIASLPTGKLSAKDKAVYKLRVDELRKLSDDAEGKLEMRELIETLSHALTQFAAAQYGLKHGVDMSGLEFNKRDWDRKIDRSINKFREQIKAVEAEQLGAEQAAKQTRSEAVQDIGLKSQLAAAAERARATKEREAQGRKGLELREQEIGARKTKEAETTKAKQEKEVKKLAEKLEGEEKKKFTAIHKIMIKDKDPEAKAAELESILQRPVKPEEVETYDPNMIMRWLGAEPITAFEQTSKLMGSTPSQTPAAKDPDAVKYAEMYNIPYNQAKQIIDKRKGQ